MTTRDQVRELINEKKMSQNIIAKSIGISQAAISQYIKGEYKGRVDKLEASLLAFMQRLREREKSPKLVFSFVETDVSQVIFEAAEISHVDGEIGVVTGNAGIGKTYALRQYAMINPDVILIEADLGFTAKALFQKIGKSLGISKLGGGLQDMFEEVSERLKGSGRMIIIDEAEHLPYRALEMVRRLHDKTGIGILLSGLQRLIYNLRGKHGEYAQIYSRVAVYTDAGEISIVDIESIIAEMFPEGSEFIDQIFEVTEGNARALEKLIKRCRRLMRINKSQMSETILNAAKHSLII